MVIYFGALVFLAVAAGLFTAPIFVQLIALAGGMPALGQHYDRSSTAARQ